MIKKFLLIVNVLIIVLSVPVSTFGQKLLFLKDSNSLGQKQFVLNNNISTYEIINQGSFVTDEVLDEGRLKKEVIKHFPNIKSEGYGVLDWEGLAMETLVHQKDIKKLDFYIGQFVRALKIVKSMRPLVKWSFYALPFRSYNIFNESFIQKNYRLAEIIKEQDFIAPSLYIFYIDDSAKTANSKYIQKNIKLALEMGQRFGKPVYPFIWQRVHPNNKINGDQLVPIPVFKNEIAEILNVKYNNKKVSGLIWWHAENYFYANRAKSKAYAKEYLDIKDVDSYQRDMFQMYYNSIKNYLNK
ncbi:hypothetical protein [Sphingobacterium multivorum]|uniref:hypothetical protein n=1 Tax=Sphingobacterium multivorum TaxID=28454 RepID=UPI00345F0306